MRCLVTGGAGFLGSHLCERLLGDGHHVICLDSFHTGRPANVAHLARGPGAGRFELVRHDVVEPFRAEVDAIYHLACPAAPVHYQRRPVHTLETALLGTRHALALARDLGAPILVASTSEIYGDPEVHPQPEAYWGHVSPIGPRSCYDEGKRGAEALAAAFARQHGVDARVVRIFNTYGPRMQDDDGRAVPAFIGRALAGAPLVVHGDGQQTRSLCYQRDLIDGLVAVMALARDPGPLNLGNPEELTVRALAELVIALTGSSSRIEHGPRPADDPGRRRPDIQRARDVLGWQPRVPLAEGLAATIADLRARRAAGAGA